MSFRKLPLQFSAAREMVLISHQAQVRSYLKRSGWLIKHCMEEVITLLFLQPPLASYVALTRCGMHRRDILMTQNWFTVISVRSKKGGETFFSVILIGASYFTASWCPEDPRTHLPLALSPTHYISNHVCLPFSPHKSPLVLDRPPLDGDGFTFPTSLLL